MVWVANATAEVDAISQWRTIVAVCVILSFLASVIVGMRLWIRARARGMAADDWMATLSLVFAIAYSVICIIQTKYGLGLPLALRPKANSVIFTRVNYSGRPIYQIGISFFKIALLISYLRLFEGTNQRMYRRVVWGAIILIFLSHLGCTFALVFACTPVQKSWNPGMDGKCLAPGPSFTGYAVVTIVSDIIVALIPIPVLLKLNVSRSKKIGLIVIFLLGLFTTVGSVMRYLSIDQIQNGDGNSTNLVLWGVIEFNVGNMVSSLPFLAPVFLRKAKEYRSKKSRGYGSSGRSHGHGKGSQGYKLSSVSKSNDAHLNSSRTKGTTTASAYATATGVESDKHSHSGSEEDILATRGSQDYIIQQPDNVIMKSVSYSVRVDHERGDRSYA
ncbi:related to integral membrane protein PTH11 [Cephalotrichum gorgonifer]|uniref:Related to integral membrane protein PTH11 n=1 Tax=Cephalotrichum gorgonifer TaxID=2041049 RepID=A0AAE8MXC0_9PEZI|nr:related to integral membrane protein PTH11 [Cephalotrichum gorgonifer]